MAAETLERKSTEVRARSSRLRTRLRVARMLLATAWVVPAYYIGQFRYRSESERFDSLYRGTQDWLTAMGRAAGASTPSRWRERRRRVVYRAEPHHVRRHLRP